MRATWRKLLSRMRDFRLVEQGSAAVEFALILPIMLLVYVGSVEASALISMDRRVQSVSGALGDLVARADATISTATLRDYFQAAGAIMTPYPSEDLKQIVTQVAVDATGKATVVWSREYADATYTVGQTHKVGDPYTLPTEMSDVAKGKFLIVAEGSYSYLPLYGIVFDNPVDLRREAFFMPRFGSKIIIN